MSTKTVQEIQATRPIGVFDSGIGGLTVASSIKGLLPQETLIYFGDTLHLPYGDKSAGAITNYVLQISSFLRQQNCKAIVVACNSASSVLTKTLVETIGLPVINVIDPVLEVVAAQKSIKRLGVIGTKQTIISKIYSKKIKKLRPDIEVIEHATPLLAPLIEEGFTEGEIPKLVLKRYLSSLPALDALVLGCTHYPLLKTQIQEIVGNQVQLIDAPEVVSQKLYKFLDSKNQLATQAGLKAHFYVSDLTEGFQKTAEQFFGSEIVLELRNLEESV